MGPSKTIVSFTIGPFFTSMMMEGRVVTITIGGSFNPSGKKKSSWIPFPQGVKIPKNL